MRRKPVRHRDEAEINVTPLLDVVFILLIFFLATTSLVKEAGLDVDRASEKAVQVVDRQDIVLIEIDARGGIFVSGRRHDARAIRAAVQTRLASDPGAPVVIQADPAAHTRLVVAAVDQARQAGAAQVSLAARAD